MAVIKTPRKKPATTVPLDEKAATKTKTAPPKKAAVKRSATTPPKPEPEPAISAKAKAPAKPKSRQANASAATTVIVPAPPAHAAPARAKAVSTLPPLVQSLYAAIQEGRPVELLFADGEANAPRTFEPRSLIFEALSQAWFVWGWDRRYNAERHHQVDLLTEVNAVEGAGRAAQGPYPEGTPANQIGGWLGGEPIPVKVILQKQWVFAVKQAPPAFPHFKIEDQGEGQALVSFTATDLRAIARWVMQFGDGAQVLEPNRLVDRVKQVGATWAGRERTLPIPPTPRPASHQEPAAEHRRPEPRPQTEPRPHREVRPGREEPTKAKVGKVETIHFDRL